MSPNSAPESVTETPDWQLAPEDGRPISLAVQQRRKVWVFPWHRFVWAEGDNAQVQITFVTHLITITGHGLAALLVAVSAQRVLLITQPTEADSLFRETHAGIRDITVKPISK